MESNIEPSINLNYPSSNTFNFPSIDLNGCSTNEEEKICENEAEHEDDRLVEYVNVNIDDEEDINIDDEDINIDYLIENEVLSMEEVTNFVQHETQNSKKRRFLNNEDRKVISHLLIKNNFGGKLKGGTVTWLASLFSVSTDVIYRIWKQVRETGDACHKRTKNCGRKRVSIDIEKVRDLPLTKRSTLQSLAYALGISKTTLLRLVKDGILRRNSNALKPFLKDCNMKDRLRFCLSMLEETSIPHDPVFKSMYNVVHIDEKWFYMTKKSGNYYLLQDEDEPYRTCKNKNFIEKVMFLFAVARPRLDKEKNEKFSGKVGMFPLVHKVAAKRSSINRASGTLETKPITSITKEVSRMFLIEKVLKCKK